MAASTSGLAGGIAENPALCISLRTPRRCVSTFLRGFAVGGAGPPDPP